MATKTLMTLEDFLSLPEPEDCKYELVEGELVQMSPTMPLHNLVRDRLLILLGAFLKGKGLGTVVSEQAFVLSQRTVRIPDIAFVRKGRLEDLHRLPEGAPDLAIEVISPSNTLREMDQKVSDYFAAGCKRVWVIYPEEHEVYVYGSAGVVTRRTGDEALEEPELLLGFSVKTSDLFE
ncbi:MAG TPA: Uma2 family endonuclease [Terriglobia bacterium]|nr:Uma2 family endonuclease [Terriglobia bacterium]